MHFHPDMEIALKLLLAALLGGVVGLERGIHRKPAGLRTSMFICLGSALFTLMSDIISERFGDVSHTRIVSNLIPGIGFLGAGAIIRERGSVVGLTTAATIFVLAGVGMAVGGGMYWTAVFTAVVVLVALAALGWLEDRLGLRTRLMTFRLTTLNLEDVMSRVNGICTELKVAMQHFQVFRIGSEFMLEFDADVSYTQQHHMLSKLGALGVRCDVVPLDTQRE